MKKNILNNLKYLAFGFVALVGLSFAHASFDAPGAAAPSANVDAPLHMGPDQVKDGGLSVNTFAAWQNAAFYQETFFNNNIFGGKPGDASSTVRIGDSSASANVAVDGGINVNGPVVDGSVANGSSNTLCADTNGTIVFCTSAPVTPPDNNPPADNTPYPEMDDVSTGRAGFDPNVVTQTFLVTGGVEAGDQFILNAYGYTITVVAVSGDTLDSITQKLVDAVNGTNAALWQSGDGTFQDNTVSGGTPSATNNGNDRFNINANVNRQFYGWANR